jgi:phosphopantothenoylcysteine synthetase/decarboxylase
MRVLTARATGVTAVAVGADVSKAGHEVHILGSPEAVLRAEAAGLPGTEYGGTRDLMARMQAWVLENPAGGLIHSAAVGDYELDGDPAGKIPSGQAEVILRLRPAPKIADHIRAWGFRGPYVTFKAAPPGTLDDELVEIARRQRHRTGSDLVFANVLERTALRIWLVGDDICQFPTRGEAVRALTDWALAARAD